MLMLLQSLHLQSQQIRFHFGLKPYQLPLDLAPRVGNEGTWCTRTLTVDHAKAALPPGQEFAIKVLSIGSLVKVRQLRTQELHAVAMLRPRCTLLLSEGVILTKRRSIHKLHSHSP